MKNLTEHIEYVRSQPHHIRRKAALTTAGAISGVIGIIWLTANVATGSFALSNTSFADAGGTATVTTVNANGQGLAGVAAATANTQTPQIQIVDTSTSTAPTTPSQQTVIPF